jgi:hypothetical protein
MQTRSEGRTMSGNRHKRLRRAIWLPVLAVFAVVPALAFGAVGHFSGKGTDDKQVSVSFDRHGGNNPYVSDFLIENMLYKPKGDCGFRSGVDLSGIKMKIKDSGKFSFHGGADSNGVHYEADVTGKFTSRRKATGHVTETRSNSSFSCRASEDWAATKG